MHLLKELKKYKLKFKSKSWIRLGLRRSISVKNNFFTNFINKKDDEKKGEGHNKKKKKKKKKEIYSPPI